MRNYAYCFFPFFPCWLVVYSHQRMKLFSHSCFLSLSLPSAYALHACKWHMGLKLSFSVFPCFPYSLILYWWEPPSNFCSGSGLLPSRVHEQWFSISFSLFQCLSLFLVKVHCCWYNLATWFSLSFLDICLKHIDLPFITFCHLTCLASV